MSDMIKDETSVRLRKTSWFLLILACLSVSSAVAAQAQHFSADIVAQHDAPAPAGRLSVLDGKVRIETTEVADGFFLVDTVKPSAYFVRPTARTYMDARQSSRLTRLFVPVDLDAPCQQWQAMARLAGVAGEGEWRCERAGEETIDGHATVVFRVLSGAGEGYLGWIDRERRFPLQIKTDDGTLITLKRIKHAPQQASSFELPASYRKFNPEALIEQIKQSDVWVSRPGAAEASHP